MKLKEALKTGIDRLKNSETPSLDAQILLSFVLNKDPVYLYTYPEKELSQKQKDEYLRCLSRRENSEPIAYITGVKEFYDLPFKTDNKVLIPRPETEVLVEEALKIIGDKKVQVLDLCCGSGAIGLSVKKEKPQVNLTLSDIEPRAIEISRENAKNLNLEAEIILSDLFENLSGKFDIILSNPPYISQVEFETLSDDIRNYEPKLALIGGSDGYKFYRKIAQASSNFIRPGGYLILETGYNQAEKVKEYLLKNGFKSPVIKKDLSGLNRIVIAQK